MTEHNAHLRYPLKELDPPLEKQFTKVLSLIDAALDKREGPVGALRPSGQVVRVPGVTSLERAVAYLRENPHAKAYEVAETLRVSRTIVTQARTELGISKPGYNRRDKIVALFAANPTVKPRDAALHAGCSHRYAEDTLRVLRKQASS